MRLCKRKIEDYIFPNRAFIFFRAAAILNTKTKGKRGVFRVKERTLYIVLAVILGIWVVLPDPVPIVADDILAALGSAAAVLLICRSKNAD